MYCSMPPALPLLVFGLFKGFLLGIMFVFGPTRLLFMGTLFPKLFPA